MVRETRHLWVGNLPDNIREDRIREHFKRYGRVQSVKLLPRCTEEKTGEITMACTVAFMDIKSASKAHNAELKIDDRTLNTEYYEPAAIPSAALPQNTTPSPYSSTSPGTTRFPNGHGSSDEHGIFPERFYERSTPKLAGGEGGESIRRGSAPAVAGTAVGYHDANRGRNRDRTSRNGPHNAAAASAVAVTDRHSRTANAAWTYESTRYNNTTGISQTDTGYSTAPSENNERRNSDQSSKKKTKSRSGSRSPSPSGSTSSRSPSRSRSRSSSSSSSSSTSRDTCSTSSPKSRRLASAANSNHQPVVHSDDRRPLAICVKNLPVRSSDTSLKDGLFHEYKKHGKVTWVKVVGKDSERHAIVCFKKPEDVEKAIEVSYDKLFFGCKIEVAPYQGYDVEDNDLRPYEAEIDEFHPKATRTLFIGNLEKDVTASDLRKHFDQFGEIIEIDIKKQGAVSSYAFCQYSDIVSVVKAIRKMDGEHLGGNRVKLGFGKSMPYNCVWVDGVNESVNEKYLKMQFDPFGVINKVHIDREKGQALIFYEQVLNAQAAVNKMRGFSLKNTKIQVDFASRECQESFFERIEKQGTILDRSVFEERRDSTTRTFEATSVTRFSRYDTPTRPRTSSYSSRSSVAASQVASALQSPGTPGSVTPRGSSSRSRSARFAEYYDQTLDYSERHFRSYDEYSQGSAASHEDVVYEHEYAFVHDSPTHLDPLQGMVDNVVPFAPPDMRNLQKERVHLLEQLEECPSSGDELISPKKRLKLDLLDSAITSDVIIEANRDHRKVMEVRRLSDVSLKHHSRRPSIDSGKHLRHDVGYLPHTVCKRRKTAGSDSGSKVHQYDHSGSESVGGSRPGTPLCDERPENFQPSEPRRVPREREGPLTLPLPRFAAQITNRGSVSVAGIKGQKDNVLSSPPPAVTSPRISNPRPPSPVHVPPPASPPPRPPSLSSNSSDSDITPPSPSLEERIKSLDEKYEKWSGSRALSAAGGDALALLDANLEKFRQRHKILDLDLKEVQPSEIVKSVMAKRSVFDEDLKRLENVGEKYEPKEFPLFPRSALTVQTSVPATPLPALKLASVTQLPKTPTMLSPRSAGTNIPAAKGLQYPFPTHPPLLMSPVPSHPQTPPMPTTSVPVLIAVTTSTTASTTATTTRGTSHGENRLKPCAGVPSDNRTSSKMNVNKSTVVSSSTPLKVCEKTAPNTNANEGGATDKAKAVREPKSSDKTSEKVACRRDSNSNSPRADVKTRRNSDSSVRRIDESDTSNKERAQSEERKRERFEKIKIENEKLEKEKSERERIERERLENEKQEKIRLEKERLEKERLERESELEKQRLEKERLEKERLEREQQEKELAEKEKQRLEREQLEKERLEREKAQKERERLEKEKHERSEKDRLERERINKEKREKEEKEKRDQELREREKLERERREREQREREEALKKEHLERERMEREEQEQKARVEQEKKEREEKERRELEMIERDKVEKEKHERERRQDEEHFRHKDENSEKKKDDHKHRESHGEHKNRENNIEKHLFENKSTKDSVKEEKSGKVNNPINTKELHDPRTSHDKNKLHLEKDVEKRKENVKENRENNVHEKHKSNNESIRGLVESRHMSIDLEKNKILEKLDPTKRKERNNSLPANIGSKRRISSHDIITESSEDSKKPKLFHDHKKLSERRDSKDSSRSEERSKNRTKNNISKSHDKHNTSRDSDEKRKEKEERHKKHKLEKLKAKSKSRENDSQDPPSAPKSPLTDKEFLNRLDLRSIDEIDKHQKECKEKRKENVPEEQDRCRKEKMPSVEKMHNSEKLLKCRTDLETISKTGEERKKRDRIRKLTNSSDTDSDEPKKHSIFDIVDDEPAYISMYDKVKARSCKNMAKLEEEKRQEKLKAKFNQLKQSRAKREEKKRSTSWDEDSDSEKDSSEMKMKRCQKMLIDSSDDESQERKSRKKKDMYSDSDCSVILKLIKQEPLDTSDDETKNKNSAIKAFKSRITSDTSEDEYNKKKMQAQVKIELFSDAGNSEMHSETEEKLQSTKVKDELERLIKKERRNSKHQDPLPEADIHIFSDISMSEIKTEKFNNVHSFVDNTSDEDNHEITKKERSERKEKKHRRKQKKQKHSLNTEEPSKLENISDSVHSESTEKIRHEKKKEHSKKEKRRDKTREGREKSKKSKKNKLENKSEGKREGKMENIFGSLSEDSENGTKDLGQEHKPNTTVEEDIRCQIPYNSESEKEPETKIKEKEDREREREEHHKKKKEKKRRERERRLQEAAASAVSQNQASNENSMDFVDMGKQLEANMMQDESLDGADNNTKDIVNSNFEKIDPFRFTETVAVHEVKREKEDRKEGKEKKKKRKKSKDEKSKHHHHHHHHHHDKNKSKTPEIKKEILPTEQVKVEIQEPVSTPTQPQNPSLPTILDENIPNNNKTLTPDFLISPMNPIISPIPKTPTTSKEKKREKFLPGFGTEIDEKIHDSAVKSISDFEATPKKEESVNEDDVPTEKPSPIPEEKPRVVISQEETEDAVAALLGESFGVGKQEAFYNVESNVNDPPPSVEESNVQDDEEMRQAVQSLSATDLDVKPDTPQSEHELQIDTDTEEQEDAPVKFDPPTKTPEPTEIEKLPKTLETPPYFRKNMDENTPKLPPPKDNLNIGSPPSLTPIRQQIGILAELRKNLEQKSLPVLSEQTQRTVIAQSWAVEKKQDVPTTKPPQASVIKIENKTMPVPPLAEPQQSKTVTPLSNRQFSSPPNLKITEPSYPPLKALSKTDRLSLSPSADQPNKVQNVSLQQSPVKSPSAPQLHNLPARSPVQMNKPPMSVSEPGLLSPKLPTGVIHNRLPITPVMASKPLQPTTVILQQAKVAHPLEPPKLVSTSDHRPQDRQRMIFQTSTIQPPQFGSFSANQPRMMIQGNIRHLPPQGLLVTTRQLPATHNFGYLANIPHSSYNLAPISKEKQHENLSDKNHLDPKLLQSFPPALSIVNNQNTQMPSKVVVPSNIQQNSSLLQPLTIPKELTCLPCTPAKGSPKLITSSPSPKPFMPMCASPKLQTTPPPISSSPKPLISVSNPISTQPPVLSPRPVVNSPISSSVESPVQTSIIQSVSRTEQPANVTVPKPSEANQLKVITELKRSTPSPVIVSMSVTTPKIVATVSKPTEVVSDTQAIMKTEDAPIKLAIETVTDELNLYLEKASPEIKEENPLKREQKLEVHPEEKPKVEPELVKQGVKIEAGPDLEDLHKKQFGEERQENKQEETEPTPLVEKDTIKEIDKFDEEKTETESIISNVSKERSTSADILAKDDPLDTKEDSDYWSAKEVNIDSVIKTLCSGDELSDHSSENGKDDWFDDNKPNEPVKPESTAKVLVFENKEEKPATKVKVEPLESRESSVDNKTESTESRSDKSMESSNDELTESKIKESVESKINESVESKIKESVENKIKESVESKIIDSVESKSIESVESKIIESVKDKISESVESKINESVERKVDESTESKTVESAESKTSESVENKIDEPAESKSIKSSETMNDSSLERKNNESAVQDVTVEPEELKQVSTVRTSYRGRGGRARGRGKSRGGGVGNGGIQTRRAKLTKELTPITSPSKRGRGGRPRNERKVTESESQKTPADIYEFRDESDEANKEQRPRLILTIKSPAVSSSNNSQTTAIFKEILKDGAKEITKEHTKEIHVSPIKPAEPKEEFTPPAAANTRKSRRLQEKDTSRNTVDDTIEDVIKNTIQTRASSNQRRSTRQTATKPALVQLEVPRKSPRGRKGRRGSEATETSSSEETPKEELKPVSPIKEVEKPKEADKSTELAKEVEKQVVLPEPSKEKPLEGLKTVVLRRLKGDTGKVNPDEPTNLIDPVTGELIPMRESEEGKYVPLPGSIDPKQGGTDTKATPAGLVQPKLKELVKPQPSVIAQTQQVAVVQQTKLQSFKAHVLSSQAAHAVVSQQPVPVQAKPVLPLPLPPIAVSPKNTPQVMAVAPMVVSKTNSSITVPKTVTPMIITKTVTPIVTSKPLAPVIITKPVTPISQHLSINTSLGLGCVTTSTNLSPRPIIPSSGAKPILSSPASKPILSSGVSKPILSSGVSKPISSLVKPPPVLSPVILSNQQKILQVSKQQMNKSHLVSPMVNQGQMVNTQIAHLKHQPVMKQQQQVIMGKGPMAKPLHQQQILSGAVPSPPLTKSQSLQSRIIQGPLPVGPKGVMEPPKVEVSVSNIILGHRPKLSPQGPQQRLVGQTGLPVPAYEASLLGERSLLNRSRSPPPAHQNSPSPKGETIAHFPPGPLRPPPEISPAHYMHPSHVIQYQQYLRQQQLHLTRSGGVEKVGDGQEGEEAPVTSPPLELRRPGSVGLALAGRGAAVPHSLHSPHDRATDSPQVGQVYNVHPTRLQHYHPNRYHFEQTEPPPAHRPMTSHGSLAALGSDRGLAHMSPMSTPDRPLSGHSALTAHMGGLATPDRPISNHVDRPISSHVDRSISSHVDRPISSHVDRPISSHVDRPLSTHGMIGVGLGAAGNLMGAVARHIGADTPTSQRGLQAATPPHASQVPPQAESLFMLLKQYPCMWQGLLALKNDQAAVQMYFVSGNDDVAKCSLPKNTDGSTPPLRIFQRMRLEPPQVEGVARKMQMENEHCMLLALPCGHDHMDVLKQSTNLTSGFITYLQQKQAAGIVNVAAPGTTQPPAYVVHIFPSCDFVNENLRRIAPSLLERVADIAHLLIVITTV